jgi:hypothetical protein
MPKRKPTVSTRMDADEDAPQAGDKAHGPSPEPGLGETATGPAAAAAGRHSAAVRMLTKPVAGKPLATARGGTQRVADAAKPTQKPQSGGGRRGPRRGASKGR